MSYFSVNGVSYNYSTFNYYFPGISPNQTKIEREFRENNITQTGSSDDLKKLSEAMYTEYSGQIAQMSQEEQNNSPWASVCAKIGVPVTGNQEDDMDAFNNALRLLEYNAVDGQTMSYFASLKLEAKDAFGLQADSSDFVQQLSYHQYLDENLS